MASRAAAPSNLLQFSGCQRGDRRSDDASQRRASDPAARRDAPAIARTDCSPAAEGAARLTARTVEIFLKGERIAAHMRGGGNHKHTTVPEHMPSSHRRYAGWTIERIRADARLVGPATASLCELILEQRPHPEQGFRACLGVVRLARPYGAERLEAAAERAIDIGARPYGSVKSILDNHLDRRSAQKRATDGTPILHANIRGPRYYN